MARNRARIVELGIPAAVEGLKALAPPPKKRCVVVLRRRFALASRDNKGPRLFMLPVSALRVCLTA